MILISIDVGIKNLAYCCLDVNNNIILNNIIDWDVLDLNENISYKCNICKKNATFFKNDENYCKIHAKKCKYNIPNEYTKEFKTTTKVDILKDFANKYNIEYNENINKKDLIQKVNDFYKNNWLEYIKKKKVDYDFVKIGHKLVELFDEKFKNIDINTVIIENQIGPLAIKMKTLQGMITQYFIIKKPNCNIHFISSINKLKDFTYNDEDLNYKDRKNKGINICQNLLKENDLLFFNKHKKKDDLADSFLQGYWFIKNKIF